MKIIIEKIHNIKSLFIFVLVISLFLACKKNIVAKDNLQVNGVTEFSESPNQKEINRINWELQDITRFFDKPIEKSDILNFRKNIIYFKENTLLINEAEANFTIEKISPSKVLGKGSLFTFFKDYLKNKFDKSLPNEISYINLDYDDSTKDPFKRFFLSGHSAIRIDDYLFLFTNDDYLLTYKTNNDQNIINYSFDDFYNKLPDIKIPFDSKEIKVGKISDASHFNYEYDKTYYKLENLNVVGKFNKNNMRYVVYNFSLIGEGEGFEDNMIVLSAYNKNGVFVENTILDGKSGGEGGANIYKSTIKENEIQTSVREEFYDVATGLSEVVTVNRNLVYKLNDNLFKLDSEKYVCNESLNQFYSLIKKDFEQKNTTKLTGDYAYRINAIMNCYPVSTNNVSVYNDIAFYFLEVGQFEQSEKILNQILKVSPERVVAWLNLADVQWENNNKKSAKNSYNKYLALMKSQNKDLSKIPQRVYDRGK